MRTFNLYFDLYGNLIYFRLIRYLLLSFLLLFVTFRELDELNRDLVDNWLFLFKIILNLSRL